MFLSIQIIFKLGQVIGSIRRRLSCTFIRAQALCLLSRIGQLGPGAKAAAQRREDAMRADTARRREAQAHWQAHIKGRGLGRVGMVFIPQLFLIIVGQTSTCLPFPRDGCLSTCIFGFTVVLIICQSSYHVQPQTSAQQRLARPTSSFPTKYLVLMSCQVWLVAALTSVLPGAFWWPGLSGWAVPSSNHLSFFP